MDIIELFNPWWKENKISKELALDYRRKIFPEIKNLVKLRQILILSGLRRVGKTTAMYQLMEDLLKEDIKPDKIFYFSFDEKIENLLDILQKYNELVNVDWRKEKCYLFFDEIQKLRDWSNKLKIIYDGYPNLKIIISGSSSFELEKEAKVNLAGRHFVIDVKPLEFIEYLELKNIKIDLNKKIYDEEIKNEFKNYLIKPFPEIVNVNEQSIIANYIKQNVIEKVLKIDLSKRFKHINEDLLERLINICFDKPGFYINYDDLAKEFMISKKTLMQHFYYLEFAYIIRKVKNYRVGARATSRKLQRAYPFHWSLRFGWNGNIDYESVVSTFLDAKYYWRENGKEVDFLHFDKKNIIPIEVKEGTIGNNDLKSLIYFLTKFNIKNGVVFYNGKEEDFKYDKITIKKIPIWKIIDKTNIYKF